jgi:hypothetical protein
MGYVSLKRKAEAKCGVKLLSKAEVISGVWYRRG